MEVGLQTLTFLHSRDEVHGAFFDQAGVSRVGERGVLVYCSPWPCARIPFHPNNAGAGSLGGIKSYSYHMYYASMIIFDSILFSLDFVSVPLPYSKLDVQFCCWRTQRRKQGHGGVL